MSKMSQLHANMVEDGHIDPDFVDNSDAPEDDDHTCQTCGGGGGCDGHWCPSCGGTGAKRYKRPEGNPADW